MSQNQPFSATDPPDADDIDGLVEWSREIVRRNREYIERQRTQIRYEPNFPRWMGYTRDEGDQHD